MAEGSRYLRYGKSLSGAVFSESSVLPSINKYTLPFVALFNPFSLSLSLSRVSFQNSDLNCLCSTFSIFFFEFILSHLELRYFANERAVIGYSYQTISSTAFRSNATQLTHRIITMPIPDYGALPLAKSFLYVRGLSLVAMVGIVGLTANFVSEIVSTSVSPPKEIVATLSIVREQWRVQGS